MTKRFLFAVFVAGLMAAAAGVASAQASRKSVPAAEVNGTYRKATGKTPKFDD